MPQVDDQGIIQFLKNQVSRQDQDTLVEDDDTVTRVESLDETITISTTYTTHIGVPRYWDDDAHTILNPLVYDGGGDNVWQ
jgi:hypothetical protein